MVELSSATTVSSPAELQIEIDLGNVGIST